MRIVLSDDIFRNDENYLLLLGLLQRAVAKKCYLAVSEPNAPHYTAWQKRIERKVLSAWQALIDWDVRDSATLRTKSVRVVECATSQWLGVVPRLTMADAIALIDTPFSIMLENGRNDRAFLLCMASKVQRNLFERLEKEKRLIFTHGGGLGELRSIIEAQVIQRPERSFAYWVLFDSDAPWRPNGESDEAKRTMATCQQNDIPHLVLERRAIENYLPRGSLYSWANSGGRDARGRRAKIDAFFRMSSEQRAHFHLKHGFPTDPKQQEREFFATVVGRDRALLAGGIDRTIAELFSAPHCERTGQFIASEGADAELRAPLAELGSGPIDVMCSI